MPVFGWILNFPMPRPDLMLYCSSPLGPISLSKARTCQNNYLFIPLLIPDENTKLKIMFFKQTVQC